MYIHICTEVAASLVVRHGRFKQLLRPKYLRATVASSATLASCLQGHTRCGTALESQGLVESRVRLIHKSDKALAMLRHEQDSTKVSRGSESDMTGSQPPSPLSPLRHAHSQADVARHRKETD